MSSDGQTAYTSRLLPTPCQQPLLSSLTYKIALKKTPVRKWPILSIWIIFNVCIQYILFNCITCTIPIEKHTCICGSEIRTIAIVRTMLYSCYGAPWAIRYFQYFSWNFQHWYNDIMYTDKSGYGWMDGLQRLLRDRTFSASPETAPSLPPGVRTLQKAHYARSYFGPYTHTCTHTHPNTQPKTDTPNIPPPPLTHTHTHTQAWCFSVVIVCLFSLSLSRSLSLFVPEKPHLLDHTHALLFGLTGARCRCHLPAPNPNPTPLSLGAKRDPETLLPPPTPAPKAVLPATCDICLFTWDCRWRKTPHKGVAHRTSEEWICTQCWFSTCLSSRFYILALDNVRTWFSRHCPELGLLFALSHM